MNEIVSRINRVNIELSNLCNMAFSHKKCPLHFERDPVILSSKTVYEVIDFFSSTQFNGKICFHNYNEPGIDPRLFRFIEYARNRCPSCYIFFSSNGYYLDNNLVNEYFETGLSELILTAYSNADYDRFISFKSSGKITVNRYELDDRLSLYSKEQLDLCKPCLAPYNELIVRCDAKIGLCCLDWRRDYIFGDLKKQSLHDILQNNFMNEVYQQLKNGDRKLSICKRCDWSR